MRNTMKGNSRQALRAVALASALLVVAAPALARPGYFEQFRNFYGISEGDNLDACGVCHFRWTGTGARNPYGNAVEQQLYIGKTVVQALTDVEGVDSDGDGFTNGQEILTYQTLPGYNCDTFHLADGAPTGYDTFITPLVATCLEPIDIRVSPTQLAMLVPAGGLRTYQVTVFNNGSEHPIEIDDYELLAAPAALTVLGPEAPFSIPLGSSVVLELVFAPASPLFANSTLRIHSNDPDEAELDVPLTLLSFPDPTAPLAQRLPCLDAIAKATTRYAKQHLKVWNACALEELSGRACDGGAMFLRLGKAAQKLSDTIGGSRDKACSGAGLTRASLGYPATCGPGCEHVPVSTMSDVAECLACTQDVAMQGLQRDGMGTAPPDLPPNLLTSSGALACQKRILRDMQKGFLKMHSRLVACEIAAVAADEESGACRDALAADLTELGAKVDAAVAKCTDTTDLLGCRFEGMSPDPACLGATAEDMAAALADAVLGQFEVE
jgi:hypothetical protein